MYADVRRLVAKKIRIDTTVQSARRQPRRGGIIEPRVKRSGTLGNQRISTSPSGVAEVVRGITVAENISDSSNSNFPSHSQVWSTTEPGHQYSQVQCSSNRRKSRHREIVLLLPKL